MCLTPYLLPLPYSHWEVAPIEENAGRHVLYMSGCVRELWEDAEYMK